MQDAMMQAAGEDEATSAKLGHTLTAMTSGTKHDGTFNKTYALRRARRDHPEVFNPVMAKNDDDRQVEWLTYKNLNDWTDVVKKSSSNSVLSWTNPDLLVSAQ